MTRGELHEKVSKLAQDAEKRRQLARLKRDTLRKAAFLKRKSVIEPHEVYHVIKAFFKEFLEQPYEFTIGELHGELKKVYISNDTRSRITALFTSLHKIEYTEVAFTRKELVEMLEIFESAVSQLVRTQAQQRGFLSWLRTTLLHQPAEPDVVITELPVREDTAPTHVHILTLVEQCYAAIGEGKHAKAKARYAQLIEAYNQLSDDEREQHYPLINQAYRDMREQMK